MRVGCWRPFALLLHGHTAALGFPLNQGDHQHGWGLFEQVQSDDKGGIPSIPMRLGKKWGSVDPHNITHQRSSHETTAIKLYTALQNIKSLISTVDYGQHTAFPIIKELLLRLSQRPSRWRLAPILYL